MKLSDAQPSTPHQDDVRYIARIELPLTADGVRRVQKSVQAYTRDHSRVLVCPTRCLGVMLRQGEASTILSDPPLPTVDSIIPPQLELKVSKIRAQAGDVVIFSLLPGGSQAIRSFYRSQVKDWADDLIVEEVEWTSWIALVTAPR